MPPIRTMFLALALASPSGALAEDPAAPPPLPTDLSELRERITRARARPGALQREVEPGTARAVLVHRSEMGPAYRLESATYALDGETVYAKVDVDGDLASRREFEVFSGPLAPGVHEVEVRLVYRGVGNGLARFWDGHRFEVQGSHRFGVTAGRLSVIRIAGYERDDTFEVPDRPALRFTGGADTQPTPPAP